MDNKEALVILQERYHDIERAFAEMHSAINDSGYMGHYTIGDGMLVATIDVMEAQLPKLWEVINNRGN